MGYTGRVNITNNINRKYIVRALVYRKGKMAECRVVKLELVRDER